jgi:hypothetical protein
MTNYFFSICIIGFLKATLTFNGDYRQTIADIGKRIFDGNFFLYFCNSLITIFPLVVMGRVGCLKNYHSHFNSENTNRKN